MQISRYFPILTWGRRYDRTTLERDVVAAVIVTIMLIPQSLAYALLAGLPAEAGLYASIVPIMIYAVFGTSNTLAVGPVAVVSLMTATAIGSVATQGTVGYGVAALTLAALSGAMLFAMGILRMGFIAHFLSHPVISGFITASGLLIALGQVQHLFGLPGGGHTLIEVIMRYAANLSDFSPITAALGLAGITFLLWVRRGMKPALRRLGLSPKAADLLFKAGPVFGIIAATLGAWALDLEAQGLAIVGHVPQSLPPFTLPSASIDLLNTLLLPAFFISLIGFVESVSVAQTLAARRRDRIDPNQELIGLGAANMGAALTGGFPVTGGFSRSVVNDDAGAATPAAGAFTALGLAIAALTLTPALYYLPKVMLAATIIVAVSGLIEVRVLQRSWRYSKADFAAVSLTILATLGSGVEGGVAAGVGLSILLHLYRSAHPHIAEVGQIAGTEHFRNIHRHSVITHPSIVTLRVDESLYFANARVLEDHIQARIAADTELRHVILHCAAINTIDFSALESLEAINERLRDMGVALHLSEVKGPVMDRLRDTDLLAHLTGQVFLSQFGAVQSLLPSK